ncbi:MAG: PhzF family phenazine biosynthesis protein [Ornithinimicrobium sp.]
MRYAAFTDGGIGGNPAGVVLDAASLSGQSRLAVAAHAGYSETAFVEESPEEGEFRVRFFSPVPRWRSAVMPPLLRPWRWRSAMVAEGFGSTRWPALST